MGASAPKRSRVGLHTSVVMKPKPNSLKAGMEPKTSEVMTPAKIASTASAAASAIMRKRKSPALALRAVSTLAVRADGSLKLISVKGRPREVVIGRNSHPAHATNITVLQSFCDGAGTRTQVIVFAWFMEIPGLNARRPARLTKHPEL